MIMLAPCDIRVGSRYRKDLGDLDSLVESIRDLGMLHAILVTPGHELIAGARRLAAAKQVGLQSVPVRIMNNLDDAVGRLKAERDENTCRLDFQPGEAVALGLRLEELERPRAKQRQGRAGQQRSSKLGEHASAGRTDAKVAEAVGMKKDTYRKAKCVVQAAAQNPDLKPVVEEMDRTGKVDPAYKAVTSQSEEQRTKQPDSGFAAKAGSGPACPTPSQRPRQFYPEHEGRTALAAVEQQMSTHPDDDKQRRIRETLIEALRLAVKGFVTTKLVKEVILSLIRGEDTSLFIALCELVATLSKRDRFDIIKAAYAVDDRGELTWRLFSILSPEAQAYVAERVERAMAQQERLAERKRKQREKQGSQADSAPPN
jgi:ParB family chromosome partitioning protein